MSDESIATNGEFDAWLDALEAGAGYYLSCQHDHGCLPPRRACPHCGSTELQEASLPRTGTLVAKTTIHVPTPAFEAEAPYTTAIVDTGPVRITGLLATPGEDIERGDRLTVTVGQTDAGARVVELHAD